MSENIIKRASSAKHYSVVFAISLLILTSLIFRIYAVSPAFAGPVLPTGGSFAAGGGTIVSSGPSMTINQAASKGIINWQGFSIGQGGSVLFNNGQGATLNRVTGSSLSSIAGLLKATGSLYLINPNGIVITSTGSVITGGDFIASTLNISDSDFLNGNLSFYGATGSVTNNGSIVSSGNTVLVGTFTTNNGTVSSSGTTSMVSGTRLVLIPENGPSGILISPSSLPGNVTNSGIIKAASVYLSSSNGDVYALAGNNGGLIEATGTKTINGQVWLTAPKGAVSVNSSVTASGSGGTILIDGLNNYINPNSILNASGSGGVINIGLFPSLPESLSTTLSSGAELLAGGINGKGFIDTSGDALSIGNITVNANGGEWLLDPEDLTIDSTAATTIDNTLGSSGTGTNVTLETTSAGTSSTVGTTTTSPSAIGTSGSSTDPGNINVDAPISWGSTASLTLSAYNSINVNSTITASGGGGLVLDYNTGNLTPAGTLNIAMGTGSVQFTGTTGSPATPTGTLTTKDSTNPVVTYTLVNANNLSSVSGTGDYALAADITLPSTSFTPIGETTAFTGIFNGLGNTVNNLNIGSSSTYASFQYAGLFGQVGSGGAVENIGITEAIHDEYSSGTDYVGGLVGYNTGNISNSYSTGSVTNIDNSSSGHDSVGGLAGYNGGTISNSYSAGSVTNTSGSGGGDFVGGLAGYNFHGAIEYSYSTGLVMNTNNSAGGDFVGGLAGVNSDGTISDSYSTGLVTNTDGSSSGGDFVGGLVGYNYASAITDSYWDTNTSGQSSSSGGTGLTDAQMKQSSNFTGWAIDPSYTGGTTADTWYQSNGYSYPLLVSTNTAGTPMSVDGTSYTLVNASNIGDIGILSSYPLNDNYALMYDITAPSSFTPIGETTAFTGIFNGLGNTVNNLTIGSSSSYASLQYVGLFGQVGSGGSIENIGVTNEAIYNEYNSGTYYVSGLVGINAGTISNSYSTGSVTNIDDSSGYDFVGGLVGYNNIGTISNSYSAGSVTNTDDSPGGHDFVGGLVGNNANIIEYSYSTGSVTNTDDSSSSYGGHDSVGGLAGNNSDAIEYSYSTGSVMNTSGSGSGGNDYVGGLAGYNYIGINTISNSYSTGSVTNTDHSSSSDYVGGLAGYNIGTITDSYWDTNTSGQSSSAGGTGLTDSQMKNFSAHTDWTTTNDILTPIPSSSAVTTPWVQYNGETYPLLRFFMTPVTVSTGSITETYDGSQYSSALPSQLTYSPALTSSDITNHISGTAAYTGGGANASSTPYTITLSGTGLYSDQQGYIISYGTTSGTLTINPADITATTDSASSIYNGSAYSGTPGYTVTAGLNDTACPSGLCGSDTLTGGSYLYNGSSAPTDAGSYGITLAGLSNPNYNISYAATGNGALTINPADINITANSPAALTYNGSAYSGTPGYTVTAGLNDTACPSGLCGSDSLTGTPSYSYSQSGTLVTPENAGSYSIGLTGLSNTNYAITYGNGTLTINPADINITANSPAALTYNGSAYSGTPGYTVTAGLNDTACPSGLCGSDSLTGTPSYSYSQSGTLVTPENAGSYSIGLTGLSNTNYAITYGNGTLTINPETLTYNAVTDTRTYTGTASSSAAPTLLGILHNGDTITGITQSFNSPNASGTNGSTLAVNTSGASFKSGGNNSIAGDYAITAGTTALGTINPAALTVTADSTTDTYNGSSQGAVLGVTYSGFVGGQSSSVLSGSLSYSGSGASAQTNAGTYVITPSGLTDGNYAITYDNGTLTINSVYSSVFQAFNANTSGGVSGASGGSLSELNAMLTGYEGSGLIPTIPSPYTGWRIILKGFNRNNILGIPYGPTHKKRHNR